MYVYIYTHICIYIYTYRCISIRSSRSSLSFPTVLPGTRSPFVSRCSFHGCASFFFLIVHALARCLSLSRNASRSLLLSSVVRVRSASELLSLTLPDFHVCCLSIIHELTHSITSVITCTQVLLLPPWCNFNLLYSPISANLFRGLCQQVLRLFWPLRFFWLLCFQYHVITVFLSHTPTHTHTYTHTHTSTYRLYRLTCMRAYIFKACSKMGSNAWYATHRIIQCLTSFSQHHSIVRCANMYV